MDVYLVVFDSETTLLSHELDYEIREYIDDNYVGDECDRGSGLHPFLTLSRPDRVYERRFRDEPEYDAKDFDGPPPESEAIAGTVFGLEGALQKRDESFQQMLFRLIEEKNLKNSEVYTRANLSKAHFSKIKKNPNYRPKKETVFALAVALELTIEETGELMKKAGYAISHSFVLDTIVEYFIINRKYNIMDINFALFDHDQPLLGEKAI